MAARHLGDALAAYKTLEDHMRSDFCAFFMGGGWIGPISYIGCIVGRVYIYILFYGVSGLKYRTLLSALNYESLCKVSHFICLKPLLVWKSDLW